MNSVNLVSQKSPSFKIIIPIVAMYTLCLYIPTIDIATSYNINLILLSVTFPVSTLFFAIIYPLSDSITEVYEKTIALYIAMSCYLIVVSFSFINNILLFFSDKYILYKFLFNESMLLTIVGPLGYIITSYINIKLISKLRIKMRGENFIIRSFICSGLSESIISVIIHPIVFYSRSIDYIMKMLLGTIFIKLLITIPFVFLAKFLVVLYRYIDAIDIPTYNKDLVSEFNE
jgi:uncharacterized PurR-regulated membrane protein YhhQ (DUF165 family)